MTEVKRSSQSLGIITLVVAILAFVLAIIPCLGLVAIVPGIIAIVLPLIGLPQAKREDSPRGMMVSGLIIAIVATIISLTQITVVTQLGPSINKLENIEDLPEEIERIVEEITDSFTGEFDGSDFSIRVEDGDNTVVIDGTVNGSNSDAMDALEELEGDTAK